MNRMDKETLQSLYPPMTEEFSARMRRMVRGLPEKKEEATMKRKYPLVLIVAAVLLLATGCTAVAAGLGARPWMWFMTSRALFVQSTGRSSWRMGGA